MSISQFNPRNRALFLIIAIVAALRLLASLTIGFGPVSSFTPVGAMALFGGAYFTGYLKPIAFPLLTLFIGDIILSFTVLSSFRSGLLYHGWFWTYAAFALMAVAGKLIVKDASVRSIAAGIITLLLIHWIVSDIGGCLREKNVSAMLAVYGQRLTAAIPYELRFLGGTIIYSVIMFGTFEWIQKKYPKFSAA